MRIAMMCHSSFGGSTRVATELSFELARRGHKIHLFSLTALPGSWENNHSVKLHRIISDPKDHFHPANLYLDWLDDEYHRFLTQLLRTITEEGIEVLHFHYAIPFAFLARDVKRFLGKKSPMLIGTLHGTDVAVYGRDPSKGPSLSETIHIMDGLTTVSHFHARLSAEVFGLPSCPEVIPNFVDLSVFHPPEKYEEEKRKVRITHISNFRPIKDLQCVARIFLGIHKRMASELWLIGDGEEMLKIKSFFKQEGIEKDIRFWGLRHNVAPLIAQSDLLLMPSLYESFCLAALEGMACGVPVIASNAGGLPEVVIHGKTGFLVAVGDYSSAVDLSINLLSDRGKYRSMKEAAALHAQKFDQKKIVSLYEDYYKRMEIRLRGPR